MEAGVEAGMAVAAADELPRSGLAPSAEEGSEFRVEFAGAAAAGALSTGLFAVPPSVAGRIPRYMPEIVVYLTGADGQMHRLNA